MLLLLGVLFLAGLAWWELRRGRQARGAGIARTPRQEEPQTPTGGAGAARAQHREPTLTLPPVSAYDALPELTTFDVVHEAAEAFVAEREEEIDLLAGEDEDPLESRAQPQETSKEQAGEPQAQAAALASAEPEPVVEWPDVGERRVVALRLVAGEERFPGRAVRQALAAEGFVLGKHAIFHRAGPDGRTVVSAADLTRPGTFERETIDRRRFAGLSLFAVLPGPLPAVQAFDELLAAANHLRERLEGTLQDERGEPLTPQRVAERRAALQREGPP